MFIFSYSMKKIFSAAARNPIKLTGHSPGNYLTVIAIASLNYCITWSMNKFSSNDMCSDGTIAGRATSLMASYINASFRSVFEYGCTLYLLRRYYK